jgi:hypothetical protein
VRKRLLLRGIYLGTDSRRRFSPKQHLISEMAQFSAGKSGAAATKDVSNASSAMNARPQGTSSVHAPDAPKPFCSGAVTAAAAGVAQFAQATIAFAAQGSAANAAAAAAAGRAVGNVFAPINIAFAGADLINGFQNNNYWQARFAAGDIGASVLLYSGVFTGPAAAYLGVRGAYQLLDAAGAFDSPNEASSCVR